MGNGNLLSARDINRFETDRLLSTAQNFREKLQSGHINNSLQGKLVATLFFQPSTRTRLSFESAVSRLGGQVIGFADAEVSRAGSNWQEGLADTAKVVGSYADAVIMRHPDVGAVREFAKACPVPVVNAGDGDGALSEHPTQALLDLFTIQDQVGKIERTNILIAGHLTQRCSHSLLLFLAKYEGVRVFLFTEEHAKLSPGEEEELRQHGLDFRYVPSLEEVIARMDVLYVPGMKEEASYPVPDAFMITEKKLERAPAHLKVLHPLPRGKELPYGLDKSSRAGYFLQAANGIPVRMAVLDGILND